MAGAGTPPDSATTAIESIYRSDSDPGRASYSKKEDDFGDAIERASTVGRESLFGERTNSKEQDNGNNEDVEALQRTKSRTTEIWKFRLRAADDGEPQDWWFASTAIPLLAATIAPLANVLSIAALVTPWRENYDPSKPGSDEDAIGFDDPEWCIILNIMSLVCGFAGNFFLLFNFVRRIRYIIALPMSIILWFVATGILMAITIQMNELVPPQRPGQVYSQGFWHAIIAAVLYLSCSLLLMINMLGYFLGHYPQHFELTEEQRNLILQTMMFFVWLAAGAAVFSKVCNWDFVDALYYCDVTILTIGFGDFFPPNDAGRGLVFPYSVGGIIILGLMVSSIRRFTLELGHDKLIKGNLEHRRSQTVSRAVTNSFEAERHPSLSPEILTGRRPTISAPFDAKKRTIAFDPESLKSSPRSPSTLKSPRSMRSGHSTWSLNSPISPLRSPMSWASSIPGRLESSRHKAIAAPFSKLRRITSRRAKLLILREEKDRFDAMRAIQQSNKRFKKYFALSMSITAFGILWCCGAVGFWRAEQDTQNLTYFQALYFCYVSLLTIGYGDLSPRSNAGKPFFIVWSLLAVPTMTILISDMGDTVVASYKRGTFTLADWTILLRKDFFQTFQSNHPRVSSWLTQKAQSRKEKERIEAGFQVGPAPPDPTADIPTLESLAHEDALNERELARKLTLAIRHMADNIKLSYQPRYSYEEWVEFTRLIRFTRHYNSGDTLKREEEDGGIIDWDWIGDDSPMMADDSESRWILDRLCESLDRYVKRSVMNGNSGIHKDFKDLKSPNRDTFEWNRRGTAFSNLDRGKEERVTRGSRSASAPKVTSMAALRMKQR